MQYQVFCQTLYDENVGEYQTFGIQGIGENGEIVVSVSDVSTNPRQVIKLAKRCTEGDLAPEHLRDVVLNSL